VLPTIAAAPETPLVRFIADLLRTLLHSESQTNAHVRFAVWKKLRNKSATNRTDGCTRHLLTTREYGRCPRVECSGAH